MIKEFYTELHEKINTSEAHAYVYYDEKYDYRHLYRLMRSLNYHLSGHKGKRVVLYGSKSIGVYAAIYTILLSGNTWVPFTPGYPAQRLLDMLNVLDADIIIYEDDLSQALKDFADKENIIIWDLKQLLAPNLAKDFGSFDFSKDATAYIMFTSGSTGKPKGVPMTHENYINFIKNAREILRFGEREVFSDYHDFAFDISIFYLFCAPLAEGAIAPIKQDKERIFPVDHIQRNGVTVWSSVPSVISRIQRFRPDEDIANNISILFLCGEPFSLDVLRYCYNNLKVPRVYDFYGLTETGVENFYHECSPEDVKRYEERGFVPIGKPLKGNEVRIADDKELLIAGCQITPGYLNGIEANRIETIKGKKWFHTGDIVEKEGAVYFCKGRVDSQVKLSGYRVELMDIEAHVKRLGGVKEAVCFVDDRRNTKNLVCAYETAAGATADLSEAKGELQKKLPEHMVPKIFFRLDEMPRNNNGKLDRKRIKELYFGVSAKETKIA